MKIVAIAVLTLGFSFAQADLLPGGRYFTGKVKGAPGSSATCYIELLYSQDLNALQTRSITVLPHGASPSELEWIAVGPYVAQFVGARSLYRFQDSAPRALVRDLAIHTVNRVTPTRYAMLVWHDEAAHHDPVVCESLVEKTSAGDLAEMERVFSRFDDLKSH